MLKLEVAEFQRCAYDPCQTKWRSRRECVQIVQLRLNEQLVVVNGCGLNGAIQQLAYHSANLEISQYEFGIQCGIVSTNLLEVELRFELRCRFDVNA